jgi:16S rRNA (cytosine967-C5)-methyltransferase
LETAIPPHQLEFFLKLILNYILKAHVSYDKAFKNITRRYHFPKWAMRTFYKIGYYTVNYYYTLRWLSAKNGYGVKPAGIVEYFSRIGFSIRRAQALIRDEVKRLTRSKKISLLHSYPEFLVKDLLKHMSEKDLDRMLRSLNTRKRWLRINTLKTSIDDALKCLDETNVIYKQADYPIYELFIEHPKWDPIGRNKCVLNGYVIPQDISSTYVVESLKLFGIGETYLLDACSAPGLKLSLAYMLGGNNLYSLALDISAKRLFAERKLLGRLGVRTDRVILVNTDASRIRLNRIFEYAIVDVPCSGLGAVYSDPAVKINTSRRSKLESYHEKQYRILRNILRYAETIVYSTCSIHPLEGEEVVERIVSEGLAEPIRINLPNLGTAYKGYMISGATYRTIPHRINGQGFYIAILRSLVVGK